MQRRPGTSVPRGFGRKGGILLGTHVVVYHDEFQRFDLLPPACAHAIPPRSSFRRWYIRDSRWARFMCARFRKCNMFHFIIYPRTKSAFSSSPRSSPSCPSSPRPKTRFPPPPFVVYVLVTYNWLPSCTLHLFRRFSARIIFRTGSVALLKKLVLTNRLFSSLILTQRHFSSSLLCPTALNLSLILAKANDDF